MNERLSIENAIKLMGNTAAADRLRMAYNNYQVARNASAPFIEDIKNSYAIINNYYRSAGMPEPYALGISSLEEKRAEIRALEAERDAARLAYVNIDEEARRYSGLTYGEVAERKREAQSRWDESNRRVSAAWNEYRNFERAINELGSREEAEKRFNSYEYLRDLLESNRQVGTVFVGDERTTNLIKKEVYGIGESLRSIESKQQIVQDSLRVFEDVSRNLGIDLIYDTDQNMGLSAGVSRTVAPMPSYTPAQPIRAVVDSMYPGPLYPYGGSYGYGAQYPQRPFAAGAPVPAPAPVPARAVPTIDEIKLRNDASELFSKANGLLSNIYSLLSEDDKSRILSELSQLQLAITGDNLDYIKERIEVVEKSMDEMKKVEQKLSVVPAPAPVPEPVVQSTDEIELKRKAIELYNDALSRWSELYYSLSEDDRSRIFQKLNAFKSDIDNENFDKIQENIQSINDLMDEMKDLEQKGKDIVETANKAVSEGQQFLDNFKDKILPDDQKKLSELIGSLKVSVLMSSDFKQIETDVTELNGLIDEINNKLQAAETLGGSDLDKDDEKEVVVKSANDQITHAKEVLNDFKDTISDENRRKLEIAITELESTIALGTVEYIKEECEKLKDLAAEVYKETVKSSGGSSSGSSESQESNDLSEDLEKLRKECQEMKDAVDSVLKEYGDVISESDLIEINEKIDALDTALKGTDIAEIKDKYNDLFNFSEKVYVEAEKAAGSRKDEDDPQKIIDDIKEKLNDSEFDITSKTRKELEMALAELEGAVNNNTDDIAIKAENAKKMSKLATGENKFIGNAIDFLEGAEEFIQKHGDEITEDELTELKEKIAALDNALKSDDMDEINKCYDELDDFRVQIYDKYNGKNHGDSNGKKPQGGDKDPIPKGKKFRVLSKRDIKINPYVKSTMSMAALGFLGLNTIGLAIPGAIIGAGLGIGFQKLYKMVYNKSGKSIPALENSKWVNTQDKATWFSAIFYEGKQLLLNAFKGIRKNKKKDPAPAQAPLQPVESNKPDVVETLEESAEEILEGAVPLDPDTMLSRVLDSGDAEELGESSGLGR